MNKLTRRAFVAHTSAGVAAAGTLAIPCLAADTPDADLIALGEQYAVLLAALDVRNRAPMPDEVSEPLGNRQFEIERRIVATPARTPAGLAVKLAVLWEIMAPLAVERDGPTADSDPEVKILWNVIDDVRRMGRADLGGITPFA